MTNSRVALLWSTPARSRPSIARMSTPMSGARSITLRVLRWVAFEEGRDFHSNHKQPTARHEVVTRLRARAITVADEAITLLRAGLASGAMARWRTLHELAVV